MIPEWTDSDRQWLQQCHVSVEGPCDHDHCYGCSCACHYADAEAEAAFDQHIIACQGATLREASNTICDLSEACAANVALIESLNRDIDIERMARKSAEAKVAKLTDERNTYRNWHWLCVALMAALLILAAMVGGQV